MGTARRREGMTPTRWAGSSSACPQAPRSMCSSQRLPVSSGRFSSMSVKLLTLGRAHRTFPTSAAGSREASPAEAIMSSARFWRTSRESLVTGMGPVLAADPVAEAATGTYCASKASMAAAAAALKAGFKS